MKFYEIQVRHVAPKDWHESIYCHAVADSEDQVYNYLRQLSGWEDKEVEGETYTIYDDNYNKIGEENWQQKMMRLRGEINDPDVEHPNAYYGGTDYGWSEGKEISETELTILKHFVATVDLRSR